jgi:predicted small lipoprotein YifL
MKQLSQGSARRGRGAGHGQRRLALGAAGLVLALAACAQQGPEYVKPTATTAYHTPQPEATPGAPAPPR